MNGQHKTSNIEGPIKATGTARYILAPGTQVREEDFGLLFYTMRGPQLYFVSSGHLLDSSFFEGRFSLYEWMRSRRKEGQVPEDGLEGIAKALDRLKDKGVILEL